MVGVFIQEFSFKQKWLSEQKFYHFTTKYLLIQILIEDKDSVLQTRHNISVEALEKKKLCRSNEKWP